MTCSLTVLLRMPESADCTGLKIVLTAASVSSCRFDRRRCLYQLPPLTFQAGLRNATISFGASVCPFVRPSEWNNSAPTGRIFMKFGI